MMVIPAHNRLFWNNAGSKKCRREKRKNSEQPNRRFVARRAEQRLFRVDLSVGLIMRLSMGEKLTNPQTKKRQSVARTYGIWCISILVPLSLIS